MSVDPTSLPFQEAIDYFRAKAKVPTAQWADMLHGAHTQAFTVAGATKDDLLTDLHGAIQKGIEQGTTLEEFRKDFDATVAKHGWDYKGTRNWRTKVIYETNLWTAYSAGRYAQMTDPDVLRYQPYWEYVHSEISVHPRPEHLAWNGLVLRADDKWWSTHYPPNGWGCKCSVRPITRRELAALGKSEPDQAPPSDTRKAVLDTSAGKITLDVPKGVDPGWGYSPGEAAHGRPRSFGPAPADPVAAAVMQPPVEREWEPLTPTRNEVARPAIPLDRPRAREAEPAATVEEARKLAVDAIGAEKTVLALPSGDPVMIDAEALAAHIDLARTRFLPFLREIIADPYEIWAGFERSKQTGKVVLRKRILKRIELTKDRNFLVVAQSVEGRFEGWTFTPLRRATTLDRARWGQLIYRRGS